MSPIAVGFVELDAQGSFHLQRLRLRPDFLCESTATSAGQLCGPEISLVWAGPAAGLACVRSLLDAGKYVLLGLPIKCSASEWGDLISIPQAASHLFVAAMHRYDSRLLTTQSVISSGVLGRVREVTCISRQYVPGELSLHFQQPSVPSPTANCEDVRKIEERTLQTQWFEMLDELLQLTNKPVDSVRGVTAGRGLGAWFTFTDGSHAHIELNRRSLAPLETGWIIEGTTGGYARGRKYRAAADYELIDVPVEPLPTDQGAFYDALVSSIREGSPFPVTNASILRVLQVRDEIEASR